MPAEEEIPADHDRDEVAQTLGGAFVVNRALGKDRGQDPDDEKYAPTNADNIFHERSVVSPVSAEGKEISVTSDYADNSDGLRRKNGRPGAVDMDGIVGKAAYRRS
jgi:hypothetical protein